MNGLYKLLLFVEQTREEREARERAAHQEAWVRKMQRRRLYMPTNPKRGA